MCVISHLINWLDNSLPREKALNLLDIRVYLADGLGGEELVDVLQLIVLVLCEVLRTVLEGPRLSALVS